MRNARAHARKRNAAALTQGRDFVRIAAGDSRSFGVLPASLGESHRAAADPAPRSARSSSCRALRCGRTRSGTVVAAPRWRRGPDLLFGRPRRCRLRPNRRPAAAHGRHRRHRGPASPAASDRITPQAGLALWPRPGAGGFRRCLASFRNHLRAREWGRRASPLDVHGRPCGLARRAAARGSPGRGCVLNKSRPEPMMGMIRRPRRSPRKVHDTSTSATVGERSWSPFNRWVLLGDPEQWHSPSISRLN